MSGLGSLLLVLVSEGLEASLSGLQLSLGSSNTSSHGSIGLLLLRELLSVSLLGELNVFPRLGLVLR